MSPRLSVRILLLDARRVLCTYKEGPALFRTRFVKLQDGLAAPHVPILLCERAEPPLRCSAHARSGDVEDSSCYGRLLRNRRRLSIDSPVTAPVATTSHLRERPRLGGDDLVPLPRAPAPKRRVHGKGQLVMGGWGRASGGPAAGALGINESSDPRDHHLTFKVEPRR